MVLNNQNTKRRNCISKLDLLICLCCLLMVFVWASWHPVPSFVSSSSSSSSSSFCASLSIALSTSFSMKSWTFCWSSSSSLSRLSFSGTKSSSFESSLSPLSAPKAVFRLRFFLATFFTAPFFFAVWSKIIIIMIIIIKFYNLIPM